MEKRAKVLEVCRKFGVSDRTFYRWKQHYGGLGIPELRELRQLRNENSRLKRLVADLGLDKHIMKSFQKKLKAVVRRSLVAWVRQGFGYRERQACGLMGICRPSLRYKTRRNPQVPLHMRLKELVAARVPFGYRRLTMLLRREGWMVNTIRVYRICKEGLMIRTKLRKKITWRWPLIVKLAKAPNQRWSMDFVTARLDDGQSFPILTVDQFTRECVAIRDKPRLNGSDVAEALDRARPSGASLPPSP